MQSLSRKYRPRTLSDVVGQPSVIQTLTNAVKNERLHQAYLFVGQFGSGKTTVARILAAMENCQESPGAHPCGRCNACKRIFEGNHPDIEEIDAASSAGKVEQVRELKKDAMFLPVDGAKTKIYIIDECHRMSDASNDALLKLLEEPPRHVRFILCTTDVQKMRPAIQSRCQRHDFRKIYWTLMSEHLEHVSKKEKVECEKAALNLCSKLANGSMRSAIENFGKLISFADSGNITGSDAQSLFGTVSETQYFELFDQIIGQEGGRADATEAFRIIHKMLASGVTFDAIYDGVSDYLRNLLVGLSCAKAGEFVSLSEEGRRRLKEQLKKCSTRNNPILSISRSIKRLNDAKVSVEYNIAPDIALQLWVLETIFAFRQ